MKNFILLLFLAISFFSNGQVKNIPKKPSLRTFTHFISSDIDNVGKVKYFRKSDNYLFDGEYTIYETHLKTKTDIPNNYYNTGIEYFGSFNKGYKNGFWKATYKDKLIKTINYNNGLVIGKYRVYNIKGELLYQTTFGSKGNGKYKDYFYKTGVLKEEGYYQNGKKEGEWCLYDEKGQLIENGSYEDGKKKGDWFVKCKGKCNYTHKMISFEKKGFEKIHLYKNEKLWQKGERYVNGEKHGVWYIYDQDENLIRKYIYKNGKLIKKE